MILNGAIGTSNSTSSIFGETYNFENIKVPGSVVKFNNTDWLVVDSQDHYATLALLTWQKDVIFGKNNKYAGSTLESECISYEQSCNVESLNVAVTTSVHGTVHKIFIPDSTCFSLTAVASSDEKNGQTSAGLYQWYSNNNYRIFRDTNNNAKRYWTASNWSTESTSSNSYIWLVGFIGDVGGGGNYSSANASTSLGFRPHVRVQF